MQPSTSQNARSSTCPRGCDDGDTTRRHDDLNQEFQPIDATGVGRDMDRASQRRIGLNAPLLSRYTASQRRHIGVNRITATLSGSARAESVGRIPDRQPAADRSAHP